MSLCFASIYNLFTSFREAKKWFPIAMKTVIHIINSFGSKQILCRDLQGLTLFLARMAWYQCHCSQCESFKQNFNETFSFQWWWRKSHTFFSDLWVSGKDQRMLSYVKWGASFISCSRQPDSPHFPQSFPLCCSLKWWRKKRLRQNWLLELHRSFAYAWPPKILTGASPAQVLISSDVNRR